MTSQDRPTVDVWMFDLDPVPLKGGGWSANEIAAAARFRSARDRRRSLAARAALRRLLSTYTGSEPSALRIVGDPGHKPRLDGGDIRFNLSHSESLCAVAVAPVEVGIDIERVPSASATSLRPWVRREAFAKATGVGLGAPEADPSPGWSRQDIEGPGYVGSLVARAPDFAIVFRDIGRW